MENTTKTVRINKYLAQTLFCSRREADEIIRMGWVLVNGALCHEMGTQIGSETTVEVLPDAREWLGRKKTIVLNKPPGFVSGPAEDEYPSALDRIRKDFYEGQGAPPSFQRDGLAPLGRLDVDSAGLLLLSQAGGLARTIIGPESEVEKEYVVKLSRPIKKQDIIDLNGDHFVLDDKKLKPAQVEAINETQFRMILKEGKKRQIRRMCETLGLEVTSLKRIRIGTVTLGPLKRGAWRLLTQKEWDGLLKLSGKS